MWIRIPLENPNLVKLFKWKETPAVLELLASNWHAAYTVTDIIKKLEIKSRGSLEKLLAHLERGGMIRIKVEGKRKYIAFNSDFCDSLSNPYLGIPQPEFRLVVRQYVCELLKIHRGIHAILVFGSVAAGTADRASDIDIFIVCRSPLAVERKAIELAKIFSGDLVPKGAVPVTIRYKIRPLCESPSRLRKAVNTSDHGIVHILKTGVTIYSDATYKKLLSEVKL